MATKLPPDPKDDPNYLFKAPIEELLFFGTSEQEKSFNAVEFSRLRNIVQRFGQQLTADEFDTLKHCMQNCINEG
jgi:hypothetical protein